jgi:hypothetical protein
MRLDSVFVLWTIENSWPAHALKDASMAHDCNPAVMRALADLPQ